MTNTYLLSADADPASNIGVSLQSIHPVAVHRYAWLIPWSGEFDSLLVRVSSLLPAEHTPIVIAEIAGEYTIV